MPLEDYRDTLLQCLESLGTLCARPQDYAWFTWRAVYITRSHFCYFFRGAFDGFHVLAEGQQIDLRAGKVSNVPATSASLYGATFALNDAVAIYDGPLKSVIEVAHAFNEADGQKYDPEFFYVKTNLISAIDNWPPGSTADPRLHNNTNLIFIGFEDVGTARRLEKAKVAACLAKKRPMASLDWYTERYSYD